jgi:restriction system protein
MDSSGIEKLWDLVRRLGDSSSARDAETLMGEILEPLLKEDGYAIQYTGQQRDLGVDFIAQKPLVNGQVGEQIAIEYKHFKQSAIGGDTVYRLLGAAQSMGIPRALLVTNSRFTFAAREAVRRNTPIGIELLDIDALRSWIGRIEEIPSIDVAQVNLIRRELSRKFIELILENPRYLDEIEWREMERLLAEVFEGLGFDVRLTPGSKDGGKDIILTCHVEAQAHSYYVEVKHWRSGQRVGAGAISDFLNVIVNEEVNGGLYLSTYGYCSNAIESLTEVQRQTLRFGSENKVVALCRSYVKAMSGIWSPDNTLPEMLYENTL